MTTYKIHRNSHTLGIASLLKSPDNRSQSNNKTLSGQKEKLLRRSPRQLAMANRLDRCASMTRLKARKTRYFIRDIITYMYFLFPFPSIPYPFSYLLFPFPSSLFASPLLTSSLLLTFFPSLLPSLLPLPFFPLLSFLPPPSLLSHLIFLPNSLILFPP